MTRRISPEAKEARAQLRALTRQRARLAREQQRVITRETERTLDRLVRDGQTPINLAGLTALVALGTGLTLNDVSETVKSYVSLRKDLNLIPTRKGGVFKS